MPLLYFLADAFIATFGITQPTQQQRQRAAFFILALIILAVAAMVIVGFVVRGVLAR